MSYPPPASEMAYAKINLALHIVGRLPNGYHQLDSVAAFIDRGDCLSATPTADGVLRLSIDGPFGEELAAADNLVIRAAQRLRNYAQTPLGADMRLDKQIPVGAGLGGGSTDAAATLRLLNRLWNLRYSPAVLAEMAVELGADIPACVFSHAARMEGIGDELTPLPHVPALPLVIAYPHAPCWTPQVYAAMAGKPFSGRLSDIPTMGAGQEEWLQWLARSHNDLQGAACELNPQISPMLEALGQMQGALLARMSGSGSACFALFADAGQAERAAATMQNAHPQWWVRASRIMQG
jgi:4-diphosphocytidyl-2-C-methyl-D-erythritol kinase